MASALHDERWTARAKLDDLRAALLSQSLLQFDGVAKRPIEIMQSDRHAFPVFVGNMNDSTGTREAELPFEKYSHDRLRHTGAAPGAATRNHQRTARGIMRPSPVNAGLIPAMNRDLTP